MREEPSDRVFRNTVGLEKIAGSSDDVTVVLRGFLVKKKPKEKSKSGVAETAELARSGMVIPIEKSAFGASAMGASVSQTPTEDCGITCTKEIAAITVAVS